MRRVLKFQSTRPARGATAFNRCYYDAARHFNPRAPRGARRILAHILLDILYFNPRAPCGARPYIRLQSVLGVKFQSTRPMRGATFIEVLRRRGYMVHFNPRAPCGARLCIFIFVSPVVFISIHAPHAGRDGLDSAISRYELKEFQSTRPMRGATLSLMLRRCCVIFQSTRPMRGATSWNMIRNRLFLSSISIHAPHAGRDFGNEVMLPAGFISIHAPHAGRDATKRDC